MGCPNQFWALSSSIPSPIYAQLIPSFQISPLSYHQPITSSAQSRDKPAHTNSQSQAINHLLPFSSVITIFYDDFILYKVKCSLYAFSIIFLSQSLLQCNISPSSKAYICPIHNPHQINLQLKERPYISNKDATCVSYLLSLTISLLVFTSLFPSLFTQLFYFLPLLDFQPPSTFSSCSYSQSRP